MVAAECGWQLIVRRAKVVLEALNLPFGWAEYTTSRFQNTIVENTGALTKHNVPTAVQKGLLSAESTLDIVVYRYSSSSTLLGMVSGLKLRSIVSMARPVNSERVKNPGRNLFTPRAQGKS